MVLCIPQAPALLEPHHLPIVQCHIWTLVGRVFTLCRNAVDVFYSPSWLGQGILWVHSDFISIFRMEPTENANVYYIWGCCEHCSMNWSTNFRGLPFSEEIALSCLRYMKSIMWVPVEINSSCCLLQAADCPGDWGCRIHCLHLCRGVRPPPNECPGYDTKQSDGEVLAVLELWEMRSTPSLPLLPGPLWPGVVAPDRALSMG